MLTAALNRPGQRNNNNGGMKWQGAIFLQWPFVAEHAGKRNEIGKLKPGSHISKVYKIKLLISNRSKTGRRKAPPRLSFTKGDVTELGIGHFEMNKGFAGMLKLLAAPGGRLSGLISACVKLPEQVTTLSILYGHLCLDFPLPGVWVGYLMIEVPLD